MNFQLMNYRVLCWFMSRKLTSRRKRSKHGKPQLTTILQHQIEEEVEAEETRIVETINNTNTKIINFMILKEEEEDEEATTQLLIDQSQQTSPMLSATDATGMVIISQNVKPICLKDMVRNLILQKRKKKYLC